MNIDKYIWHPFTQEKTASDNLKIIKGEGAFLYDEHGKSYLDLIASWWVNIHGHANKEIADAIYEQARTLEHVIFAGFTHDPAMNLCERLLSVLPSCLNNFFFSDNGSTAVEVALKMAYQYFYNKGIKQKKKFIAFHGGYHGDTFGAMSLGRNSGYHSVFDVFFFDVIAIDFPDITDENAMKLEELSLFKLKIILEQQADQIAAIILEPLIQGAAGMKMCSVNFLEKVVKLCKSYDVIVIFDEVFTGIYRTGKMFAMDYVDAKPDILCISKCLTGGFLPLALTITTQKIYNAFLGDSREKALLHGHTYTGNPIACAAACMSFDILMRDTTQFAIKDITRLNLEFAADLRIKSSLYKSRSLGAICAFSAHDMESANNIAAQLLSDGVYIRPIGCNVYFVPPYCVDLQDLSNVYKKVLHLC